MPEYRNSPIEEAMCEFAFAQATPPAQWDLTLPGRVQQHPSLRDVYSGLSRQQHVQQLVSEQVGTNSVGNIALATSLLRVLIPTSDGKAVLGIGQNTLSVSSLRKYEGWPLFKPRIRTALDAYAEVAKPTQIVRLNLKYVNRIIAPSPKASAAADYLRDIEPIHTARIEGGKAIQAALNAYHYRKEFLTDDNIKIIITQATLQAASAATSEFLLDIEAVYDNNPFADFDEAAHQLDRLHAVEGAMFESFITDAARKLFNED